MMNRITELIMVMPVAWATVALVVVIGIVLAVVIMADTQKKRAATELDPQPAARFDFTSIDKEMIQKLWNIVKKKLLIVGWLLSIIPLSTKPSVAAMMVAITFFCAGFRRECYLLGTSAKCSKTSMKHGFAVVYSSMGEVGSGVPIISEEDERNKPKPEGYRQIQAHVWEVTIPFNDIHEEFGVAPKDFMALTIEQRRRFIERNLEARRNIRGARVAICKSDNGYEHIHIVVRFKNCTTFGVVKNFIGKSAHVEAISGKDVKKAVDYLKKTGHHKWKHETVISTGGFGDVYSLQGKRNDIVAIRDDIDKGYSVEEIFERNPGINVTERLSLIRRLKQGATDTGSTRKTQVYFVTGFVGSGKTASVKAELENAGTPYRLISGDSSLEMYGGEDAVIIENPTPETCSYDMIMRCSGSEVADIKVRYGHSKTQMKAVYITTNLSPEDFATRFSWNKDQHALISYICVYRYCFKVISEHEKPGYMQERYDGRTRWFRYDHVDIPVTEHAYRGIEDLRMLATAYFTITKNGLEYAEGLEDVVLTKADLKAIDTIGLEVNEYGAVVTPDSFISMYNNVLA